ncbi:hypothetical protein [Microbispora bryophytorum]|uniref:Uncharacterized protein n=1 Tax=Microbispora bryophytorum TaxID=1460882 RepID=A0A8H9H9M6_9ACTN|nr:hypothetical protein [Microbispora bryophytorum]MBD3139727.1 hypothetical protein [Microbispora bryophytorum]TQS02716.1 hypothetical protein FLX07_27800 [Microbispora bryophytorum]GGO27627.1 hypothetical protein GCM10011574_61220 [Microbispora bryophytorum]
MTAVPVTAFAAVLTVDRVRLRVAEALMLLPRRPYGDRDVHDEIVEQCLLMNETLEDGEPLGDGYLTGIVLERRAGRDDPETLAAAGETAFGEWLADRRRRASIEWHWL